MTGVALSIDPSSKIMGYALIFCQAEKVWDFGIIKSKKGGDWRFKIQHLISLADFLIIEDQYVGINPRSALIVAAAKGEIIGMWGGKSPVIEIKPVTWQAAIGANGNRDNRKRVSMQIAKSITGQEVPEDAADAINLGLAAIRREKAIELIEAKNGNA